MKRRKASFASSSRYISRRTAPGGISSNGIVMFPWPTNPPKYANDEDRFSLMLVRYAFEVNPSVGLSLAIPEMIFLEEAREAVRDLLLLYMMSSPITTIMPNCEGTRSCEIFEMNLCARSYCPRAQNSPSWSNTELLEFLMV